MSQAGWQQPAWGAPVPPPAGAPVPQAGAPAMPPAQQRPAQWTAPTHPGPPTNALAIWAILAASLGTGWLFTIGMGLGSIAAIVLGAIALGQIRRTGDDGRLLAVWAIVLGSLTLAALVVGTVIGFAGIAVMVERFAALPGI